MATAKVSDVIPIVTTVLAVAGFLWGVYQYTSEQAKNRDTQIIQQKREADLAEQELMKPWLDSQRQIYSRALSAAATVANSDDGEKGKNRLGRILRALSGPNDPG